MNDLEQKRIFLIASGNEKLCQFMESFIKSKIQHSTVFTATDGMEALFKADNVVPHVLIVDPNILKVPAMDVVEKLIHRKERLAAIILHPIPENEQFVDEVVTGQIQFLSRISDENLVANTLSKALDWVFSGATSSYRLRFLAADEILIRDGEKGDFVYLVKTGTLKAYKNEGDNEVELGIVHAGEFVGEMAYINGEARSATVSSITPCELIEMPIGSLDNVLFSKPAWSKALMKTLSKRLKKSNEEKLSD